MEDAVRHRHQGTVPSFAPDRYPNNAWQTFRFKTRLQRLNSIEASSRAKVNFLEQLYRYHRQQGNPRVSVPTINHKALDLWLLRKEVQKLGGYDEVESPWL
jgi:hypothetical protein